MEHISKFLSKRITQQGFSQQVKTSLIIEEFKEIIIKIFGSNLGKKIKPLYIKNNILTVACLSSVMAQEMNFRKAEILEKINAKFSPDFIKDIRLVI
ncbi:MAG: DUF721 domain-containing protein [Patescibacteria group bacterium]